MTELLYRVDKWGGVTFDIMSTGVHEYYKWIWTEETDVLTVEPVKEMINDLNRICRPDYTGDTWHFEGLPDYPYDIWQGAYAATKHNELVRMRFEFANPRLVPLFKLMWHNR